MKRITSIFIVIVTVLLALCSCVKKEDKNVSALMLYREFDIERSVEITEELLSSLIKDDNLTITTHENEFKIELLGEEEKPVSNNRCVILVYETVDKAKTNYESVVSSISHKLYRYSYIRINNVLLIGRTDYLLPILNYYSLPVPQERELNVYTEKISSNKDFDADKFLSTVKEMGCKVYSGSKSESFDYTYDVIISADGQMVMSLYTTESKQHGSIFDSSYYKDREEITIYREYSFNNAVINFIDDFWLDIIKQCEK